MGAGEGRKKTMRSEVEHSSVLISDGWQCSPTQMKSPPNVPEKPIPSLIAGTHHRRSPAPRRPSVSRQNFINQS